VHLKDPPLGHRGYEDEQHRTVRRRPTKPAFQEEKGDPREIDCEEEGSALPASSLSCPCFKQAYRQRSLVEGCVYFRKTESEARVPPSGRQAKLTSSAEATISGRPRPR
jgi:hypothetical protein